MERMFTSTPNAVLDEVVNDLVPFSNAYQTAAEGRVAGREDLLRISAGQGGKAAVQVSGPFSIETALDEHVEAIEVPRPPDGKWHPSSLYGCARKAIYEFRGKEATNPPDARARRVFRVGHIFHQFAQDAVDRMIGGSVRQAFREVPVEIPELNVVGHADGLVQFDSEVWELQEYKSIKGTGFKYGGLPKPDHVGQVTPYIRALRDYGSPTLGIPPLGDDLTRARLAYMSKDDMQIAEFSTFWSQEKNDDLVLRVGALEQYREGDALPPRMPEVKGARPNFPCNFCAFADRCWEQDEADGEALALELAA